MSKRFYQTVSVAPDDSGFKVLLDSRALKTPAKQTVALPTIDLAELVAGEWAAQQSDILPETMPLTRLANVALDRTPIARRAMIDEVAKFAETDTCAVRAEGPEGLVARETEVLDPVLDWLAHTYDLDLCPRSSMFVTPELATKLSIARARVAMISTPLDDFALTGLTHAAGVLASCGLALALFKGRLSGEEAFAASRLEEAYQNERWGKDSEAEARAESRRRDCLALAAWFRALSPQA